VPGPRNRLKYAYRTINDSFDPLLRLKIFSKLGARWIKIPYTQPALDSDKEKVENLYLLTFPVSDLTVSCIDAEVVINFLKNLYKSLLIENPYADEDFLKMVRNIEQQKDNKSKIQLYSVPPD